MPNPKPPTTPLDAEQLRRMRTRSIPCDPRAIEYLARIGHAVQHSGADGILRAFVPDRRPVLASWRATMEVEEVFLKDFNSPWIKTLRGSSE